MKSVVSPDFGDDSTKYGCIICENNNFDVCSIVNDEVKPYIKTIGKPIILVDGKYNLSKMNVGDSYVLKSNGIVKTALYDGTKLVNALCEQLN